MSVATPAADRRLKVSAPKTFAAQDLRVFLNGLEALGYDGHALLASAGMREADLLNPDAWPRKG